MRPSGATRVAGSDSSLRAMPTRRELWSQMALPQAKAPRQNVCGRTLRSTASDLGEESY